MGNSIREKMRRSGLKEGKEDSVSNYSAEKGWESKLPCVIGSLPASDSEGDWSRQCDYTKQQYRSIQYFLDNYINRLRPKDQEDIHVQYLSLYVLIPIQRII